MPDVVRLRFKVHVTGRCGRCGRKLRNAVLIGEVIYGRTCAKRVRAAREENHA